MSAPSPRWTRKRLLIGWRRERRERRQPCSATQTVLLRPEVLDFWGSVDVGQRQEFGELMEVVPALFNRLVVFDPRIPHGVRRVQVSRERRMEEERGTREQGERGSAVLLLCTRWNSWLVMICNSCTLLVELVPSVTFSRVLAAGHPGPERRTAGCARVVHRARA